MPKNWFLSSFIIVAFGLTWISALGSPDDEEAKELLYRELSTDAYFSLPCHNNKTRNGKIDRRAFASKSHDAYTHMNWKEWDFETRNSKVALSPPSQVVDRDRYETDLYKKSPDTLNPDAFTIFHLCYAVSYIWRRGRKGIHRYYNLRDTYVDHMPFEIGYITQVIMAKYQNVLELYELSTKMEGPENKIGRPHLFFFYKNILEDCRTIIHLCNMMHEVTRKYRVLQHSAPGEKWIDVLYDPSKKFQEKAGHEYMTWFNQKEQTTRNYERGIEGFEHEKYRHEDPRIFEMAKKVEQLPRDEQIRLAPVQKDKRWFFLDHGHFTAPPSTRPTKKWQPKDGMLAYGWSPEEVS